MKLPAYIREELLEGKFIASVMNSNKTGDFGELRNYISECIEYGHSPASQGAAFVVCVALLKDFEKVVKFIQNNRDEADGDQAETRLFIEAIKNYKKENIIDREKLASKILNPDTRDKMHAEMRILALIRDKLNQKNVPYSNYIGISKLCCLACHAMIYAVNRATSYENSIEIRGAHNVDHSGAWHAPFNITGNPSGGLEPPVTARRSISSKATDSFEAAVTINFNAILKVKTDKKLPGSEGVSEYADYSQTSEEERDNYYHEYCVYLLFMEKILQKRKKISPSSATDIASEIEILRVGLKIYEDQAFKDICNTEFDDIEKRAKKIGKNDFQKLFTLVTEKEQKLLIIFLKNPLYAGEKVSEYFSRVDLSVTPVPEGRRKRRGSQLTS